MKNVIIPMVLIGSLVVAMVVTVSNRSSAAGQPEAAAPPVITAPQDPYGAPLGGDVATEAASEAEIVPAAPVVAPAAGEVDAATAAPSAVGGEEPPATVTTVPGSDLGPTTSGTPIPGEDVERAHGEEDPGHPDLALGEFPITSNVSDDYPLEAMVDLAVALLNAEITGVGRDQYPHLAGQFAGPCCEGMTINGAVVLFGETAGDPAKIVLDWQAFELGAGGLRQAVTETRWWYQDGSWVGEFER